MAWPLCHQVPWFPGAKGPPLVASVTAGSRSIQDTSLHPDHLLFRISVHCFGSENTT